MIRWLLTAMSVACRSEWWDITVVGDEDDCLTAETLLAQREKRENSPPAPTRAPLPALSSVIVCKALMVRS
ncbi:unnamed protein product [Rodentolepis nana]|uniref:Secreted protein n=1 Tax=Rodentolepis nana TaxID=102285 RepID=A0A0R3T4J9_RODNA|nr:unnamed protein product [Rodentolepis nana]